MHLQSQASLGVFGTTTNHGLAFKTNDTQRIRIDEAGLVGIATTAPEHTLSVTGTFGVSGNATLVADLNVGDDLSLTSDAAVFNMGAGNDFTITHDGADGATLAGHPVNITSADSSVWKTTAGTILIDSEASSVTVDGHLGVAISATAANVDINAATGVTVDGTTISIDGTDDSNVTVTASGKDLDIAVAGGSTQELRLASAGTGGSALHLNASAGSVDIDSADNVTVDAADEITLTTTSADGHITLASAHTAGVALHIDADADAGSIVDIDAGILDIDVTAGTTLNTTGLTITDTTTSSATEGGAIRLVSDDGAVMADNHRLGVIEFAGAEDTSNTITVGASIEAICDATWSATENGAALVFSTTDGNASTSEVLRLDSNMMATFAGMVNVAGGIEITSNEADTITATGGGAVTAGAVSQSARKGVITIDLATNSCNIANMSTYTVTLTNAACDADSVIAVTTTGVVMANSHTLTDGGCKFAITNSTGGAITANFTINYVIL